jgi:hypothetical protein
MKRSRIGTPDASKVRHDGFQEDGMLKKVTITDARDHRRPTSAAPSTARPSSSRAAAAPSP